MHQNIIKKLHNLYQINGYIDEDVIFDILLENNIKLEDIECICDQLLAMGVIIQRNPLMYAEDEDTGGYDRSRIDYDAMFDESISIDKNLSSFIYQVRKIQPPQHREWQRLIPQAKNGNMYAFSRLVLMYLRSVIRISIAYHKKQGTILSDTIQEGCIGLIMAIHKFEGNKQDSFPQFYPWWVMRSIQTKLPFMPNPLFYFPAYMKEKLNKVYEVIKEHDFYDCLQNEFCPELVYEVTDCLDCTTNDAQNFLQYYQGVVSIENVLTNNPVLLSDGGRLIEDVLESNYKNYLKSNIDHALDLLNAKEKKVLWLRYGFDNGTEYTLEQIGNYFGVTRERIRQIEAKALKKLKNSKRIKHLGFENHLE